MAVAADGAVFGVGFVVVDLAVARVLLLAAEDVFAVEHQLLFWQRWTLVYWLEQIALKGDSSDAGKGESAAPIAPFLATIVIRET